MIECLSHYLAHRLRTGMARSTALQCKSAFERFATFLQDHLRRTPTVLDLTRPNVERWLDDLALQPGRLGRAKISTSTVHTAWHRLRAAWEWLYDREEYEGDVQRPRRIDLAPAGPRLKAARAPTWEQLDALIEVLRDRYAPWKAETLVISRYMGLRIGQSLRLRWSDVDFNRGVVIIRGELGKSRQERRGRVVPASPHLLEHLAGRGRRDGFLVQAQANGARPSVSGLQLRAAWERTGAPEDVWSGQTSHCCRKAMVTWLRAERYDEPVVAHLVGHRPRDGASGQCVTDDVYLDVQSAFWRECVQAVEAVPRIGGAGNVVSLRRRS